MVHQYNILNNCNFAQAKHKHIHIDTSTAQMHTFKEKKDFHKKLYILRTIFKQTIEFGKL